MNLFGDVVFFEVCEFVMYMLGLDFDIYLFFELDMNFYY